MPAIPKELSEILDQLGISEKSLQWIRFGGVVGKMSLISVACVAGVSIVAFKSPSLALLWGCLIAILAIGLVSIIAVSFHGHRHPLEATLEGGQIVALKHVEQAYAAKGRPQIPQSNPVPPPQVLPAGDQREKGGEG